MAVGDKKVVDTLGSRINKLEGMGKTSEDKQAQGLLTGYGRALSKMLAGASSGVGNRLSGVKSLTGLGDGLSRFGSGLNRKQMLAGMGSVKNQKLMRNIGLGGAGVGVLTAANVLSPDNTMTEQPQPTNPGIDDETLRQYIEMLQSQNESEFQTAYN